MMPDFSRRHSIATERNNCPGRRSLLKSLPKSIHSQLLSFVPISTILPELLPQDLNVAITLVNQCMSDPGAMAMFATVKPVGGHVLAHASTTRIHLKKGRVSTRP